MIGAPAVAAAPGEDAEGEFGVGEIFTVIAKHPVLMITLPLLLALTLALTGLSRQRTYTASTSFMPQESHSGQSAAGGMASQLGFQLGDGANSHSPAFYAKLLTTRELLAAAVESEYRFLEGGALVTGTLVEVFNLTGATESERREAAIETLRDALSVGTDQSIGLVNVEVALPNPELAEQVAERLPHLVNEFNLTTRRSQVSAEREFTEARVTEARSELRAAEERLRRFLEQNRQFANSPTLAFQHARLEREIRLRENIYSSLAESYEEAKIQEVRNTPVINIFEHADGSARANGRGTILRGLAGLIIGSVLALLMAFGIDARSRRTPRPAA